MGQYFKAVNTDKNEFVCPWCIGQGAKLWEWAANSHGAIFTLLLRKSDATGGGDVFRKTQAIHLDANDPDALVEAISAGVAAEGKPFTVSDASMVGRWAGDSVMLIGDYDSSKLWKELSTYRNISREVVDTWNAFIEIESMQLQFNADCSCNHIADSELESESTTPLSPS